MQTLQLECQIGIVYVIQTVATPSFPNPAFVSLNGSDWLFVVGSPRMGDYPSIVLKFDEALENNEMIDVNTLYQKFGNTLIIQPIRC